MSYFGVENRFLETLLALLFFTLLLIGDKKTWFWSGFFIGIFWFYWIGISFVHYKHPLATPFIDFIIALIYAFEFWLFAMYSEKVASISNISSSIFKALSLLIMSYIHPFGFNWFKPELVLVHSYFGVDKLSFVLVLIGIYILTIKKSPHINRVGFILLALITLTFAYNSSKTYIIKNSSKSTILVSSYIQVEKKWRQEYLRPQVRGALNSINLAIKKEAKLVVLPESVLPIFLNKSPKLLEIIKSYSQKIDIIIGSLYLTSKGQNRNSAYFFHKGEYKLANKIVLVPFGESNPLPNWASKIVNRIFFDGAPDYTPASKASNFIIDKKEYRVGVCYEGTSERLYEDNPKRLILISNDGWFHPSTEATLQRLLLEYYARKYGTTIWHSINMEPSYIIKVKGG